MVKEVKDYVATVQERWPWLTKSEVNKILTYGLKRYAWVNKMHADVLLCTREENDPMVIHCGPLGKDRLKHYWRFITKNRMRERVLFYLKKQKWDGYYYIGLTQRQQDQLSKVGKKITFKKIYPTKLKRELFHIPFVKHIWRIPWIEDCGWKFYIEELRTDKAEYIGENHYEKYHQCFLGRSDNGSTPAVDTEQHAE